MENNNNGLNKETLDKITTVCTCKAVKRSTIKNAIKNGSDSFEGVKRVTGAGSGACCGNRCKEKIEKLINDKDQF